MIDAVVPIPKSISAHVGERMESHHSQLPTPMYKPLWRPQRAVVKIRGKMIFR